MIFQKRINYYPIMLDNYNAFKSIAIIISYFIVNNFAYLKSVIKMLMIALFIALVPLVTKPEKHQAYSPNIKFDTKSSNPAKLPDKVVIVTPGESEFNKTEREKNEAISATSQYNASSGQVSYDTDPSDFDPIYKAASAQFGVPWELLKAVHYVETGCSGSTSKGSYAGARGPMQFMAGTWRTYGVDGNSDGVTDICNVTDAIYGAANLLANSGAAEGNIDGALFNYNHSLSYVNKVKDVASSIH